MLQNLRGRHQTQIENLVMHSLLYETSPTDDIRPNLFFVVIYSPLRVVSAEPARMPSDPNKILVMHSLLRHWSIPPVIRMILD